MLLSELVSKCQSTALMFCTVHFIYDLSLQSMKPNEGLTECIFSFVTRGFPVIHIHPQLFFYCWNTMFGSNELLMVRFHFLPDRLPLLKSAMLDRLCSLFFSHCGVTIRSHSHLVRLIPFLCQNKLLRRRAGFLTGQKCHPKIC